MESEDVVVTKRPPVRVGIVGLGRSVFSGHLSALKALPDLYNVTAVCDLLKERRDIVEQDFPEVHTYRRIEDMMDDQDIELILCTLPTADHVSCALESLRHNFWTVIDSPIATTHEDAKILQAASVKARNKLFAYTPALFAPDFRLALSMLDDPRLGEIFEVRVCKQDYIRRDDWQSVKRCQGGCVWYDGVESLMQAVQLMRSQPTQLWSELKRVASLGDAEDYAHIVLKSRTNVSADIELCGGQLPPFNPAFTVRAERGAFTVAQDATEGTLHIIDPDFKFSRRRSSVRTPPLSDMHEEIPVVDITVPVPGEREPGSVAFWRNLFPTIRTASPFPIAIDDVVETIRYLQLVKRASTFGAK